MQAQQQIILHLDLDYFFAQAEEIRNPDYKNKPLIVCVYTDAPQERGVVATANYVARKFGVRSGMPIIHAKKALEGHDAVFLAGDFAYYQQVSDNVREVLKLFGDMIEQASVDEWFIDVTIQSDGNFDNAKILAESIKKGIFTKIMLTCSVGVASNKLVSKIASNFKKPDGLTIVKPEEVQAFLDPLEVNVIPGIGKKTQELLAPLNISKIEDIRNKETVLLVERFGKLMGSWLYRMSRGMDNSEILVNEEQKQISRIITLKEHSREVERFGELATQLITEIAEEMKQDELTCSAIGVIGIDTSMKMHTRSKTFQHQIKEIKEIKKIVSELFIELVNSTNVEFRRIGVKVERLASKKGQKVLGDF